MIESDPTGADFPYAIPAVAERLPITTEKLFGDIGEFLLQKHGGGMVNERPEQEQFLREEHAGIGEHQ